LSSEGDGAEFFGAAARTGGAAGSTARGLGAGITSMAGGNGGTDAVSGTALVISPPECGVTDSVVSVG